MSETEQIPTEYDDKIREKFEDIIAEYEITSDGASVPDDTDRMIKFLCLIGRLKSLPRRGWLLEKREIKNPESISSHMYRMAIMSMLFDESGPADAEGRNAITAENGDQKQQQQPKLDMMKMMQMSLIHDMAECIVGDITPYDRIDPDEKHQRELSAIEGLVSLLPKRSSDRFYTLYREYEAHQSPEALLVKELDRFDICLQAFQYERQEYYHSAERRSVRFDEFFAIANDHVKHPMLRKMVIKLAAEREQFWQSKSKQSTKNEMK